MTDAAKADGPTGDVGLNDVGAARSVDPEAGLGAATITGGRHRVSSRLSDQAQARIGNNLRSLYDSIVQQPVPDRFRELIERLDAQEPKSP